MNTINDGGPAFPMPVSFQNPNPPGGLLLVEMQHGLSVRDWFAGQAPDAPEISIADAARIIGVSVEDYTADLPTHCARYVSWWRYRFADAMLDARSEPAQSASDTAARLLLGEVLAISDRLPAELIERIRAVLR